MSKPQRTDTTPWYKQFWPWLIIGLLVFALCFCFTFIYLAVTHEDPILSENYYQEGLNINKDLERQGTQPAR